jgi:hypothetical protein
MTGGAAFQAARQFLAATVETTPDTPAPVLFDQAARARACLAALLAEASPAADLARLAAAYPGWLISTDEHTGVHTARRPGLRLTASSTTALETQLTQWENTPGH